MRMSEHVVDALKATPVAGYVGGWLAGFQWGTAASVLAAFYSLLLIGEKLWKWYQAWQAKRETVA